jgi:hypothetical protein
VKDITLIDPTARRLEHVDVRVESGGIRSIEPTAGRPRRATSRAAAASRCPA